jgi:hypothetical protein
MVCQTVVVMDAIKMDAANNRQEDHEYIMLEMVHLFGNNLQEKGGSVGIGL